MINYNRQFIDKADINSVVRTLKSDLITQGQNVVKFEKNLSRYFGSKYSCVVSNGTAALHLLGLALRWKKNDVVLTTPISFLATSNAIVYSGATPHFIDIENETYNIDINLLKKKIIDLKKKGKKIVAIICTDFAGHPCNWPELYKIKKKFNIKLINDCCHAMGASIFNNKQYAIKYADYVTLSFHAIKNITTGEGGAILSNDKNIIDEVKILRTHGVIRNTKLKPWFYKMIKLGFNYRITDFQCALGISQLKKLNKFVKKRKKIAKIYDNAFKNSEYYIIPKIIKKFSHAYHLYPLRIKFQNLKINKEVLFHELKKFKINLQVHYIPIYNQPYYKKKFNNKKIDFPNSESFYKEEVSLPIYYSLSIKNVNYIINQIRKIIEKK